MAVAAIPTEYAGVRFRSRLEARWASFFDLCGWRWDYEPLDLDGYIPDFMLWLKNPVLVEIKPLIWDDSADEAQIIKAAETKIRYSGVQHEALLLGARLPSLPNYYFPVLGLLNTADIVQHTGDHSWWEFSDHAEGFKCLLCGQKSFGAECMSWRCRVNGCYDGSHREGWDAQADFRSAGNAAQWKAR